MMQRTRIELWIVAVLFLLAGQIRLGAQEADAAPDAQEDVEAEFDRQSFLDSFDQVWRTIDEMHWDPEVTGAAWDAARDRFRPVVEQAADAATARKAIQDLLAALDQSHFGIVPRETYAEMERLSESGGEGWSGLVLRLVDGHCLVARVMPGSPAAAAGILPGWELMQLRDQPVSVFLERAQKAAGSRFMRPETIFGLIMEGAAGGAPGDRVVMELLDESGVTVQKELELVAGPGKPAKFGFLPMTQVEYRSVQVADERGTATCVAFNAFLDGPRLSREFAESVEAARGADGLIIDLRGNMGGLVALTMGMCGWLFDEPRSLGEMQARRGKLTLNLNPRKPAFDRPVAVLIDECSISAAEIMAGALQDLGRVRVFGRRSAGMVLPSTVVRLPNGDGFQYALSDYVTATGRRLEATGVVPDETVPIDRGALLAAGSRQGHDPDIDAAMRWIQQVSGGKPGPEQE